MNRIRVLLIVAGALVMGYALAGALTDPDVRPFGVLIFLAAVLVGHDAVWMPLVLVVGVLLTRFVPARYRAAVQVAALCAAAVAVVAVPVVLGPGAPADNPSVLPLDYPRNLGLVLITVAALTVVAIGWGRRRKKIESTGGAAPVPGDE